MIEPLPLPEAAVAKVHQFARLMAGRSLEVAHGRLQWSFDKLEEEMDVVRHDDELENTPVSTSSRCRIASTTILRDLGLREGRGVFARGQASIHLAKLPPVVLKPCFSRPWKLRLLPEEGECGCVRRPVIAPARCDVDEIRPSSTSQCGKRSYQKSIVLGRRIMYCFPKVRLAGQHDGAVARQPTYGQ